VARGVHWGPSMETFTARCAEARSKRSLASLRTRHAAILALATLGAACRAADHEGVAQATATASSLLTTSCEIVMSGQVPGDYEVDVDPQDPAKNLLVVTHGDSSAEDTRAPIPVFVARLDGATGRPIGAPVAIANNYKGIAYVNGPELTFDGATKRLGVLFRGPDGVHAAWRPSTWAGDSDAWSSFVQSYDGGPFQSLSPPRLSGTSGGRYPAGSPPLGLTSYDEFLGPHEPPSEETCMEKCYGYFGAGTTTDVKRTLAGRFASYHYSTAHPGRSGVVIFSGCATSAPETCGLWEARVAERPDAKGRGTLDAASVRQLAVEAEGRYDHQEELRAELHPVTGDLVVFAGGRLGAKNGIDVLTCATPGAGATCPRLKRIARFPWNVEFSGHYRAITTDALVYLHFLVRPKPLEPPGSPTSDDPPSNPPELVGSYVIGVSAANIDGSTPVAPPTKIDGHAAGAELVYMPKASRTALFFKERVAEVDTLQRCFLK
jgi:hypothetical protein